MRAGGRTGSITYSARTVGVSGARAFQLLSSDSRTSSRSAGSSRVHVTAPQRRRRS